MAKKSFVVAVMLKLPHECTLYSGFSGSTDGNIHEREKYLKIELF